MSDIFLLVELRKCCISRCFSALMLLVFCVPLFAQSVAVVSEDGRQVWYTPNAAIPATLVDEVIRLSGDSPKPPGPTPPGPIPPQSPDQWGLVALSESEAVKVTGDPNHSETASKLSIAYGVIGKQFQDGTIPVTQVKAAIELTFRFATGDATDAWRPWQIATQTKYNAEGFTDVQQGGQGIIDIGIGAGKASTNALGDGKFLELFMKFLPILLKLLELFGSVELDTILSEGV